MSKGDPKMSTPANAKAKFMTQPNKPKTSDSVAGSNKHGRASYEVGKGLASALASKNK